MTPSDVPQVPCEDLKARFYKACQQTEQEKEHAVPKQTPPLAISHMSLPPHKSTELRRSRDRCFKMVQLKEDL